MYRRKFKGCSEFDGSKGFCRLIFIVAVNAGDRLLSCSDIWWLCGFLWKTIEITWPNTGQTLKSSSALYSVLSIHSLTLIMLVCMEIISVFTIFLGHFTRRLPTVHWLLTKDRRWVGNRELVGDSMCTGILTDTQVCTIRHNSKFHLCNIRKTFNLRRLANTVNNIWLQIISTKDPFSQVFPLEMDPGEKRLCVNSLSLYICRGMKAQKMYFCMCSNLLDTS
jgi:hypothetical protein